MSNFCIVKLLRPHPGQIIAIETRPQIAIRVPTDEHLLHLVEGGIECDTIIRSHESSSQDTAIIVQCRVNVGFESLHNVVQPLSLRERVCPTPLPKGEGTADQLMYLQVGA